MTRSGQQWQEISHQPAYDGCDKTPWPRQLIEQFTWAYSPRGIRVYHHGGKEARQWVGMAVGIAKRELTSGTARREGTGDARRLLSLKTYPSDELPPARSQCLSLPKQCHQLGINYSNAWEYGKHLTQTTAACLLPPHGPPESNSVSVPQCLYKYQPHSNYWINIR